MAVPGTHCRGYKEEPALYACEIASRRITHLVYFGLWCNGNTTVFGAVFLGSNPSKPTKKLIKDLLTQVFICIFTKK